MSPNPTEYILQLTEDNKLKIYFEQNKGSIEKFVIQYYSFVNGRWRSILRIDNCHGFPHQHVYHLRSKEHKEILDQDANRVFTEAQNFVKNNFTKILDNFLYN